MSTVTVEADNTHVSEDEARLGASEVVGAGTPETAPDDPAFPEFDEEGAERVVSGKLPTRKWLVAFLTALVVFAATKLAIPLDPALEQLINVVIPLAVAYYVKNNPTPGGVPDAKVE